MKNLVLIHVLFCSTISFSQSPNFQYWDFQLDTVSRDQFSIDSTISDNFIWQIGQSNKPFFGNTNVLVTDTLQMYNGPIDAAVDMLIARPDFGNGVYEQIGYVIEFDHKMDTDSISAGGFIELNVDNDSIYYKKNGDTLSSWWMKILLKSELDIDESYGVIGGYGYYLIMDNADTIEMKDVVVNDFLWFTSLTSYYHKIYGYQDSLYNNINGFTGTYNSYQNFYMDFMFAEGGVKVQDINDTLNFRFHFISDGTSGGKNGWAIRNIKTGYSVHPTGSVDEKILTDNQIISYPNPTENITTISLQNPENKIVRLDVFSIDGKFIATVYKQGSTFKIDVSKYEKGTYIIQYFIDDKNIGYSKVIKY